MSILVYWKHSKKIYVLKKILTRGAAAVRYFFVASGSKSIIFNMLKVAFPLILKITLSWNLAVDYFSKFHIHQKRLLKNSPRTYEFARIFKNFQEKLLPNKLEKITPPQELEKKDN